MPLFINSNPTSVGAQRRLGQTQNALAKNLRNLSSGLRVNTAADDAAGLAISNRMTADIRSYAQAERNALDGISMIQTVDGAANEVTGLLTRMRELAVQSANGTLNTSDRSNLNTEFGALKAEITRISEVTEFNGTKLMDHASHGTTATTVNLQVGINHAASNNPNVIGVTLNSWSDTGLGVNASVVDTAANATTALGALDIAIDTVSTRRAGYGSLSNRLDVTISNLSTARENTTAANSRIRDVDVASETASMTRNQILSQAGVSMLAQANQMPQMALSLLG